MNILFTCGGTAGHINPAIALARLFQLHHPGCNILFAGAYNGMERDLVPKEGYQLRTVYVNTIQRAFRWKDIKHNLITVVTMPRSRRQAAEIIRQYNDRYGSVGEIERNAMRIQQIAEQLSE